MQRRESRGPSTTTTDSPSFAKQLAIELVLTAVSAALSFFVLQALTRNSGFFSSDKSDNPKRDAAAASRRLNHSKKDQKLKFDQYEDIIAGDMVFPEEIEVNFTDIGGHEMDKREIYDLICLPLKHPEVFSKVSKSELLSPPKGILLYGPPGTGKTMMAKAIAKESGAAFINLKMSTTMNLYFGESQKLVRATFSLARKLSPCIIFIDEIDSFLHERKTDDNSALGNMKAEFMSLWDGVESSTSASYNKEEDRTCSFGIVVVGATNRPWDVDPAILRRMPRTFQMALPDERERENVLRLVLRSETLEPELERNLAKIAKSCVGYSGSDLKEMCRAAVAIPYREFATAFRENPNAILRPLSLADFQTAKKNVRPAGESASKYQQETEQQRGNQGSEQNESFLAGVEYGMNLANARKKIREKESLDALD